jgi:hypothetical protein
MYSIGAFAELGGVSIRMLRHCADYSDWFIEVQLELRSMSRRMTGGLHRARQHLRAPIKPS